MEFLYTAFDTFDKDYNTERISWSRYIEWTKMTHLSELVTLDGGLSEQLVKIDYNKAKDWDNIHFVEQIQTNLFKTLEYVLKSSIPKDKFNLLTVVIRPTHACNKLEVEDYEFVGYELLDKDFCNSLLTNFGGFDHIFLPTDLNDKGLIDDFSKVYEIKERLLENNPDGHFSDGNVIAVWRHKTIGR